MRIFASVVVMAVIALCFTECSSAATASAGTRDSAFYSTTLARWSVGVNAGAAKRDTESIDQPTLDTREVAFFLGCDLASWLTLFGTAGVAEFQYEGANAYGNATFKWSGGLQASLWRADIVDPEFLAGTLMFKAVGEYSQYKFDDKDYPNKPEWSDIWVALPLSYEMYVSKQDDLGQMPYSLLLSVGPALSTLDGFTRDNIPFSQKQNMGVFGSADIYLAHNLSVGFHVQYFDYASMGGSLMYHF